MHANFSPFRRRDPKFFLALNAIRQQAEELRHRFRTQYGTQEDANAAATQLPPPTQADQSRAHTRARTRSPELRWHHCKYPMLALALIEPNLATAIQQVHAKMIKDREYLTQLKT